MSSRKRKSPRPHKVNTKNPRYNVAQYKRGSRVEFWGTELESYHDPRVYYPNQKLEDFRVGDKVAYWNPSDNGIYLDRGWTIKDIVGNTVIMSNPNYGGDDIKFWNGKELAKTMVLMERKEPEGSININGKTYSRKQAEQMMRSEIKDTYGSGYQLVKYEFLPDSYLVQIIRSRTPEGYKNKYMYHTRILDAKTKEEYQSSIRPKLKAYEWFKHQTKNR